MTNYIGLFLFFLILIATILIYRRSDDFEPYLFLKLIGYTILGGFTFHWNDWRLPLGFLVFLLFFRNSKVNAKAKKRAAYVGLVVFLLQFIIPFIETTIYEWPRKVELQNTNFYNGSMVEEWKNIHNELGGMSNGMEVTDFKMVLTDKGEMEDLRIDMEEYTYPQTTFYRITLAENDEELIVKRKKVEREPNLNEETTYTEASFFLAQLDLIKKPMLNHEGAAFNTLRSSGQRTGYGVKEGVNYQIDTAGKEKVPDAELPIEAIVVDVCDPGCEEYEHFLFDVLGREPNITDATVLDVAQQDSIEIERWLKEHSGDNIGYEENGEYLLEEGW